MGKSAETYGEELYDNEIDREEDSTSLVHESSETQLEEKKFVVEPNRSSVCSETSEELFKCDMCCKTFCDKSDYDRHIVILQGTKTCGRTLSKKDSITKENTNMNIKSFTCETCNKSFRKRGNLNVHTRIHRNEKPFTCETCCKSFRTRSHLTVHLRIHKNEKPFTCDICSKCFRTKTKLSNHIIIHIDEKPFKCETCKKCFRRKWSLSLHVRIHRNDKFISC